MLMPGLFGDNLLNDFFDVPALRNFSSISNSPKNIMYTDVKENEGSYEIDVDLPGFKKEDVQAELKDGYLIISAVVNTSDDVEDEQGKYIHRERYRGSCSRSFYVGEAVAKEDIKAKFEDGVLKLDVPKRDTKKVTENKHYISIEG